MDYELDVVEGPFQVILRTSGVASVKVFTKLNDVLQSDPRISDGMNMLLDHTDLDLSQITTEQIRAIADNTNGKYQGRGGHVAIVMSQPAAFGLGRMWQSMTGEALSSRTRVVHSVEAAYRWLETEALDPAP
jgi:hypothetical protein